MEYSRCLRGAAALLLVVGLTALSFAKEFTVEELKARVANAAIPDRPPLCIEIAEKQLAAAERLYVAGDIDRSHAALVEVTAFSELARDYAIQSHKHDKQSEISVRKMARKLENFKHTVAREDQKQVQDTVDRLERVRDDLLAAMFPNGGKK
ncbi:MAG: hypothetical protein ABSF15_16820 [Candidatus Sulfotelmatobacter sp.]|jgi:hypothetical protein